MKNLTRKPQGDPGKVALERQPDPLLTPEVRERQRQAAALVLEWAQEKGGYDEEIWPLVEDELSRLADEALAEHRAGLTQDLDPDRL